MDVEERGGEFVQKKGGAVVVYERALETLLVNYAREVGGEGKFTNPRVKTQSAATAWAQLPSPNIGK